MTPETPAPPAADAPAPVVEAPAAPAPAAPPAAEVPPVAGDAPTPVAEAPPAAAPAPAAPPAAAPAAPPAEAPAADAVSLADPSTWPGWDLVQAWLPDLLWVLIVVLIGVALGFLGGRVLRRFTERWAAPLGPGRATLIGRIVGPTVFGLILAGSLHLAGLPLAGMWTWVAGAAGIAGVAIGFASQTSASNIISGMFLLGERPFEEGDFVRIGEVSGQVLSVELLSVKLRTFDNLFVRVPNETAMRSVIINLSRFEIRRIDLPLRFSADAPLSRVDEVMRACAATQPYILVHPEPLLVFNGIVDGAVEIQVSAWTRGEGFVESRAKWAIALIDALRDAGLPLVGASRSIRMIHEEKAAAAPDPD